MNKFQEKEMMKRPHAKNIWYNLFDCLIIYVPVPIKKWWVLLKTYYGSF